MNLVIVTLENPVAGEKGFTIQMDIHLFIEKMRDVRNILHDAPVDWTTSLSDPKNAQFMRLCEIVTLLIKESSNITDSSVLMLSAIAIVKMTREGKELPYTPIQ